MEIALPQPVLRCIEVLEAAGFEAYAVGGCVRDALRGLSPKDFDLTASCPPEEIMRLFEKTAPTGLKHGTVTVISDGMPIEVTRFRVDEGYSDGRRPDRVRPAARVEDDLARRDFTVNAMAWNPRRGLKDPFGGRADLAARIIRCVGDPETRFTEDALRILRAYRFCARMDFDLDPATAAAAEKNAPRLRLVSAERVFGELEEILAAPFLSRAAPLLRLGLPERFGLPPVADAAALEKVPNRRELRFAALCVSAGADPAEAAARLKADRFLRDRAARIAEFLRTPVPRGGFGRAELKRLLRRLPPEELEPALAARGVLRPDSEADCAISARRLRDVLRAGEPWHPGMLAVGGEDLLRLGFRGPALGEKLRELLELVVENPELNRREILLARAAAREP